jgi:catechol 2,3-dioxygenase-like lactoylglutathione lyase family enzyme
MNPKFTHVTFVVSDVERTIAFYAEFFGLTVVRDRRKAGGSTVWLGPATPEGASPPWVFVIEKGEVTNRLDHLGFQCASRAEVDALAAKAAAQGVLASPPKDSGGAVGYWALFRDPDGNLVEATFGQPIAGV